MTPGSGGAWTETLLLSFSGVTDGNYPYAGLAMDAGGNLYGTTLYGGDNAMCQAQVTQGCGTVFELSPSGETVLHSFGSDGGDGAIPYGGPILDRAGNLYGTTQTSDDPSTYGYGTIFKLSRKPDGTWSENILHVFSNSGKNGTGASSRLVMDTAGNLYGTAEGPTATILTPGSLWMQVGIFTVQPSTGATTQCARLKLPKVAEPCLNCLLQGRLFYIPSVAAAAVAPFLTAD